MDDQLTDEPLSVQYDRMRINDLQKRVNALEEVDIERQREVTELQEALDKARESFMELKRTIDKTKTD